MLFRSSNRITSDPLDMLWHLLQGEMPMYEHGSHGQVQWLKYSHRGVQFLDKFELPRKQKRYIFSPDFEIRYDQAFDEVVRACADICREGHTWITPELAEGYGWLHRMGFAHSYECWQDGKLVGGSFGIQIGGFISCDSMFHRVSNASKAAWGQTLVRLKERGFKWVDTNFVSSHLVNFGEEWIPQWKFEHMVREAIHQRPTLADEFPCPALPWSIRAALPAARVIQGVQRRVARYQRSASGVNAPPEPSVAADPAER